MQKKMTYKEAVEWLYNATPQFQRIGAAAYKPGLETAVKLAAEFGNPHRRLKVIHVAGTNGKGSTCHTLAAVLRSAGYKTGLYTSPHLVDFRERIRVDGDMISKEAVSDFTERWIAKGRDDIAPSFFELTTIMAFDYFARNNVDVAVIETGLGGRLDTTNIVTPELCVITNISLDHVAQLGNHVASIAREKAGIIKQGVPVVIGNSDGEGVRDVFVGRCMEMGAQMIEASRGSYWTSVGEADGMRLYKNTPWGDIRGELTGDCQEENAATVMAAILQLQAMGWNITAESVAEGMSKVVELTGLQGRWMKTECCPDVICDTGHNTGGWQWLAPRLASFGSKLKMVIGFVNDKDVSHIMEMMPRDAEYFFTRASIPRALEAEKVMETAVVYGLKGKVIGDVPSAVKAAKESAAPGDVIFVGGSTFVVADYLASLR